MLVGWVRQTYFCAIGTHVNWLAAELGPLLFERGPASLLQADRKRKRACGPCAYIQQGGLIGKEFEPLSHKICGECALAAFPRSAKHDSAIAVGHHSRMKGDVVVALGIQEGSGCMHQAKPNLLLMAQCQETIAVHADDPASFLLFRREATARWLAGWRAIPEVVQAQALKRS